MSAEAILPSSFRHGKLPPTSSYKHRKSNKTFASLPKVPLMVTRLDEAFEILTASDQGSSDGHQVSSSDEPGRAGRIPEVLKRIFIESNQGQIVNEPPRDHSAFKAFERSQEQMHPLPPPPMQFYVLNQYRAKKGSESLPCSQSSNLIDLLIAGATKSTARPSLPHPSSKEEPKTDSGSHEETKSVKVAMPSPPKRLLYPSTRSPQVFLDVMLRTLGYSTDCFKTLETSYYNKPTPLQTASYHARLQEMIRSQDETKLRELMTCGISTNPCNQHGESLLHNACRNANTAAVKVLFECGASVQVSDDVGRTVLHSAMFAVKPCFELVDLILSRDRYLLQLCDRHGTALSYIPRDQWGLWIDFLYAKRHMYFPSRRSVSRSEGVAPACPKMKEGPNTCPLPDPSNALPPEMASMVVSGKLTPQEARCFVDDNDEESSAGSMSLGTDAYDEEDSDGYSLEESWIGSELEDVKHLECVPEEHQEEEEQGCKRLDSKESDYAGVASDSEATLVV